MVLKIRSLAPVGRCTPTRAGLPLSVVVALTLAGCGDSSIGSSLLRGSAEAPKPADLSQFAEKPICPPVEIRFGTEAMLQFEPGKQGDLSALRFQTSVQRVARECDILGDNIVARVGVAGRVVSGPKGATGKVNIPVRIVAMRDDKVVYSSLKVTTVDVAAGEGGASWSLVDEAVTFPANASVDTLIYVGLDEKGKVEAPKKTPVRPKKQ